jgi:hypothetical protein
VLRKLPTKIAFYTFLFCLQWTNAVTKTVGTDVRFLLVQPIANSNWLSNGGTLTKNLSTCLFPMSFWSLKERLLSNSISYRANDGARKITVSCAPIRNDGTLQWSAQNSKRNNISSPFSACFFWWLTAGQVSIGLFNLLCSWALSFASVVDKFRKSKVFWILVKKRNPLQQGQSESAPCTG